MGTPPSPGSGNGRDAVKPGVESRALPVAGIDEAGRGPLAGPVVAAAVLFHTERPVAGVADSKTLSPRRREQLEAEIKAGALDWGIGACSVAEIDTLNILNATLLAMERAVQALRIAPRHAMVDGNRCPQLPCTATAIVRGDLRIPVIGAASILAKVARDRIMLELDTQYPAYGFARHKGYPTPGHLAALREQGPSPAHRMSFAPVRRAAARESVSVTGRRARRLS